MPQVTEDVFASTFPYTVGCRKANAIHTARPNRICLTLRWKNIRASPSVSRAQNLTSGSWGFNQHVEPLTPPRLWSLFLNCCLASQIPKHKRHSRKRSNFQAKLGGKNPRLSLGALCCMGFSGRLAKETSSPHSHSKRVLVESHTSSGSPRTSV